MLRRGSAFLIPSGPNIRSGGMHLFVVAAISKFSSAPKPKALLLSVCSIPKSGIYDGTCILQRGDHPFIRHPSYIFYMKARIEPLSKIERNIQERTYIKKPDVEAQVLNRISEGLLDSPYASRSIIGFYKKCR